MLSNELIKISIVIVSSLISLFWGFTKASAQEQTPNMISVCDVLANPKKYDGQMVTIQAALVPSLNDTTFDELAPLESDRCYRLRRQDNLRVGIGGSYM